MAIGGAACPEGGLGPQDYRTIFGVCLSVVADTVIAVSLAVQKTAHNRNWDPVKLGPRVPFTKIGLWWVGMLMNAGGEIANLAAYGLAPASIVTPVGCIGVFVNSILATCVLKEPLRRRDVGGLGFIVGGIVLVVLGVPEVPGELTDDVVLHEVLPHPRCWGYLLFVGAAIAGLLRLAPRRLPSGRTCGETYALVYLMLCSLISSLTVIGARAFSSMATLALSGAEVVDTRAHLSGLGLNGSGMLLNSTGVPMRTYALSDALASPLLYASLALIVGTAVWSVKHLQQAMQLFGNAQVVPVYYSTFTLASVVGASVVYDELDCLTPTSALMFGGGVLCAVVGVFAITSGRIPDAPSHAAEPISGPRKPKPPIDLRGIDSLASITLEGLEATHTPDADDSTSSFAASSFATTFAASSAEANAEDHLPQPLSRGSKLGSKLGRMRGLSRASRERAASLAPEATPLSPISSTLANASSSPHSPRASAAAAPLEHGRRRGSGRAASAALTSQLAHESGEAEVRGAARAAIDTIREPPRTSARGGQRRAGPPVGAPEFLAAGLADMAGSPTDGGRSEELARLLAQHEVLRTRVLASTLRSADPQGPACEQYVALLSSTIRSLTGLLRKVSTAHGVAEPAETLAPVQPPAEHVASLGASPADAVRRYLAALRAHTAAVTSLARASQAGGAPADAAVIPSRVFGSRHRVDPSPGGAPRGPSATPPRGHSLERDFEQRL